MEFEFTSSIYIIKADLDEMARRVKEGEPFEVVFDNILANYDDYDYYSSGLIRDDVRKEIERRMS